MGGLKPRDPDSVGLGWDLGLWMLSIHAHAHMNTLTFLYGRTHAQVYTQATTRPHRSTHITHVHSLVPTFMHTCTHTSPTPRAASTPCTAPPRDPGAEKLSLSWRQSEHQQLGYQSRSRHPPIQEGRVGRCRGKDEDRRDTDAAVRGSLHWGSEGSECHSHATPHTRMCAQGSPTCPAETHRADSGERGPDSWGSWSLSPHGSQAYMHGLPHPASPSGCSLGPGLTPRSGL